MESFFDHIMLSRMQFGFTAMFHILWPVLTIGLSIFLVYMEAMWLKTGNKVYRNHYRFWVRLFVLNFAVGVVSGIPMEFQFGTNWDAFSQAGGDFFGHILGYEGAIAFMLEASFLGIMIFGRNRVSPKMHLFATIMVALGGSMSAFWIMLANSWMHTPTGGVFENGAFVIKDYWQAIFNPDMPWGVSHMWVACLEITIFVVGGISAWYLLKNRHAKFFLKSFKVVVAAAIVATPLQIYLGDGSGLAVFHHQPTKMAAMEAHWNTNPEGVGATWHILAWPDKENQRNKWSLDVPYALSLISTHTLTGQIQGLSEFPPTDQPSVWVTFYSFRVMIGIGFGLFFLMLWTLWAWKKGRLHPDRVFKQKKLLWAWMLALPASYVAMEAGWVTREMGRQPWILYNILRTDVSASTQPAGAVGVSLLVFAVLYALLMAVFLVFLKRILAKGPDLGASADGAENGGL